MSFLAKPSTLHDREREWAALAEFASDDHTGARLGMVYGRRRQGKTLMLDLMAAATSGFGFTALPQSSTQNLDRLARALARYTGGPQVTFPDWDTAVDALLRLGEDGGEPAFVFLDEFQYLVEAEPALPSLLQMALGPTARATTRGRIRLVLCGSALSTMRGLLAGSAPLRGRATLEMMVHPFGYRDAAAFWGLLDQPDLAFRVHALLGGTPAYRAMAGDPPPEDGRFVDWVVRGPLGPMSALFREGAVLLQEEPELADTHLYYSVLGAVARGASRRHEIASALGRSDQALTHPLAVLERTQLIERAQDALRRRRPSYRIAEPILRTHQLLVGPNEADLVGGAGDRVWREHADTVTTKIYGPHFEELARQWCRWHAAPETLGGRPSTVLATTLNCPAHQRTHELDAVVIARRPNESDTVLAIGEAKATSAVVDTGELHRLEHIRELLPAEKVDGPPRLLLFSRTGFTSELRAAATRRDDVVLVDVTRLYHDG